MPTSYHPSLFALLLPVSLVLQLAGVAHGDVVVYDTSGSSVFQCESIETGPQCEAEDGFACNVMGCGGPGIPYCGQYFFLPGSTSDEYSLYGCPDGNTVRCDSACTCKTGTTTITDDDWSTAIFVPDGGDCPIMSTEPGVTLAPQPTPVPATQSPTLDASTAVLYNATGLDDDMMLYVTCDASEVYCDVVYGYFTLQAFFGDDENGTEAYGWAQCGPTPDDDESGPKCLLRCSSTCTCSLQLYASDGNGTLTDTGESCPLAGPTPSPTVSPAPTTVEPTPGPSSSSSSSAATALAQAVAAVVVAFGTFLAV